MRTTYLIVLLVLIFCTICIATAKDESISYDEFSLNIGDRVDLSEYRIELIEIQSLRDGLVVIRVSKTAGGFDEQRVLLENSANKFDGGSEDGGLTVTATDIFDEQSAKIRIEYPAAMGTPKKRSADIKQVTRVAPNLMIEKTFDKANLNIGDQVKVTVNVKNIGTDTARDIQVLDQQPLPEFVYLAGYPPKIKTELEQGESDSSVYIMSAVKEGLVKVPKIEVRYSDSKGNVKTNSTEGLEITIAPARKPNLEVKIGTFAPMEPGSSRSLNVTLVNSGQASATRVEVTSSVRPDEGLQVDGLDKTFFEIPAGGQENYSATLTGDKSGNYTIEVDLNYLEGESTTFKKTSTMIEVKEREYKYLYYLLILPIILIAYRIYKRHKEYDY